VTDYIFRGQVRVELIAEFRMPSRAQWPVQRPRVLVDRSTWRLCHGCGHPIPVQYDFAETYLETFSYVCPACLATQRGSVHDHVYEQRACHGCKAALASDGGACEVCGLLRGWATVNCPWCGRCQAVHMPHLASVCNLYVLECYGCETRTVSGCIC
jgi:hypothetical protein